MSDFKVGDIVKLKSHSTEMMVNGIVDPGMIEIRRGDGEVDHVPRDPVRRESLEITCVWIDDYGQPHRETYVAEVLEISRPDPLTVAKRKVPTKMDTETEREGL